MTFPSAADSVAAWRPLTLSNEQSRDLVTDSEA